jgi:hypothetical protein
MSRKSIVIRRCLICTRLAAGRRAQASIPSGVTAGRVCADSTTDRWLHGGSSRKTGAGAGDGDYEPGELGTG